MAAKNEKKNLKEFAAKYRERSIPAEKAVIEGKEYFPTGFEKITSYYKMKLAFDAASVCARRRSGSTTTRATRPSKPCRASKRWWRSRRVRLQEVLDSPHIRYYKQYLYQGQWSGIPLFTQLKPHGEGMLIFFDGWVAREEKVVYIELIACSTSTRLIWTPVTPTPR